MARGRVAIVLALAACRGAAAAPAAAPAELGVPSSWIALPKVAAAAQAGAPEVRAAAWGDPARGCYLVIVSARGAKEDAEEARHALASGLGLPVGLPIDGKIEQAGLRGQARGWSEAAGPDGDDVVSTAAACVYNDREPAACAAGCDAVWAKMSRPPVIP